MLDALAFDTAYRKYARALRWRVHTITDGSADAEDVAHDAWAEAWKARDNLELPGLWSWLVRVAKRCWWWRINPDKGRHDRPIMVPVEEAASETVEGEQEAVAQRAQIESAADSLGPAQRDAVKLTLAGMNQRDIADAKDASVAAVGMALRLGIKRLREKWCGHD